MDICSYSYSFETRFGKFTALERGGFLTRLQFGESLSQDSVFRKTPLLELTSVQIREYLDGTRSVFKLPFILKGTSFQKLVWNSLYAIPYGKTRSYRDIAREIGKPQAQRAVGAACAKNPILIVIPCHRVVSSSGSISGYAAGVNLKQKLLELEQDNFGKF